MYENSLYVNPKIRNFWINLRKNDSPFHIFKKNKNLVFFGNELSKKSFEFISDRINKLNIEYDLEDLGNIYFEIIKKESKNEKKLKVLAIKAVTEAFQVPEELLVPNLNVSDIELNKTEEKRESYNYEDLSQQIKDEINKRILLNCVIQGASIHSFYTLHHIVKNKLDEINTDLTRLYDKFSVGSVRSYFSVDYSSLIQDEKMAKNSALGSAKVEYNKNQPKIIAKAKTFPVLCQELVKGVLELISFHGLKDIDEKDLDKIYYFADKRIDEPRYIQIGSQIWRNLLDFMKLLENRNIPECIMNISTLNSKEIQDFFEYILQEDYKEALDFYYDKFS